MPHNPNMPNYFKCKFSGVAGSVRARQCFFFSPPPPLPLPPPPLPLPLLLLPFPAPFPPLPPFPFPFLPSLTLSLTLLRRAGRLWVLVPVLAAGSNKMCAESGRMDHGWNGFGAQDDLASCLSACSGHTSCNVVVYRPSNGYCTGYTECSTRDVSWQWSDDVVSAKS